MAFKLVVAALCVLANAFFVAAEFALVKVRVSQLKARARKGEAGATATLGLLDNLDAYLSATQLGITLASLALGWLGGPAVAELIAPTLRRVGIESDAIIQGIALTTAVVLITTVHFVLGEQAPKLYAIQRADSVAVALSRPMRWFYVASYPFMYVLNQLSVLMLKSVGMTSVAGQEGVLSAEEIRLVVASGEIEQQKRELMARVLQGTDRPVRSVMVPRVDMATVSLMDTPEQIMETLRIDGYSRVPVIEERDPDKVVGYIYLKDLFLGDGLPAGGIRALRRDILFVPENRTVGEVLKDFQRTHIPIAIVVDEYGGTSGVVTMEDVLEEIVGELQDELDVEAPPIVQREDGTVVVEGTVPISELQAFGIEVEQIEGREILAGHLVALLGRLARPGDIVRLGDYDATVEDVRSRRITRVRLVPRAPEEPVGRSVHPPSVAPPSVAPPSIRPERDPDA